MMKIWFSTAFLIIVFCDTYSTTHIKCFYTTGGFIISNDIYYCSVNNDPNIITPESAQNCTISGQHISSKTNDDVSGFFADSRTIKKFPQGLEKYFKNLQRIFINHCNLEEIHQSDLKPFTLLTHFYVIDSIEVIEEGLFDYNPNLEWLGFSGSKIIHIDPNVFDKLSKLKTFWFESVPCVRTKVDNSYEKVKEAIIVIKRKCRSPEFVEIEEKIKNLENESKTSTFDEFKEKFEIFEKSFITSKFSKYRPLNQNFSSLKESQSSSKSVSISSNLQSGPLLDQKVCPKADYPTEMLLSDLKNISELFKDIKSTQCGKSDPILYMNTSMTTITSKINDITSSQDQLVSSHDSKFKELKESQKSLKSALDGITESISDIEVTLSNVKTSQNDFKSSLSKIKTSQNEIRIALDELKDNKDENSGDELAEIREKLEGYLLNFEVKNADKLDKIEKELVNARHKLEINLDEKIKGIEKRIVKKFEEILEEKLAKILEDKLNAILNSKLGTQ